MSKGRTSKVRLGLLAALLLGLFAFVATPVPALAAEVNSGGLIFTFDNAQGQTNTTVSQPSGQVITVSGVADITVTQDQISNGSMTYAIQLDGYSGTITFNNVTLIAPNTSAGAGADPAAITISNADGDNLKNGATVVLDQGSTILQGASATPAALIALNSTDADITDTINIANATVGSAVGGTVGANINYVTTNVPAINVAADSDTVVQLGSGTVTGGGTVGGKLGGAINYVGHNTTNSGTLTLQANGSTAVNGLAAPALNVDLVAAVQGTEPALTIQGEGTLSLTAGKPSTANKGNDALDINTTTVSVAVEIAGPGVVNATGSEAVAAAANSSSANNTGGNGVEITSTASDHTVELEVSGGTLNAKGGLGATTDNSAGTDAGANGGAGISIDGNTATATLSVTGGTVNATGGDGGGTNSSTTTTKGGDGGAGITGPAAGTASFLNVSNGTKTPMGGPTITALGGKPGSNSTTTEPSGVGTMGLGITNIGAPATNAGQGINIASAENRRYPYPWVALTNDGGAPTSNDMATVIGFAGMDGAPTSIPLPDAAAAGTSAYQKTTQAGLVASAAGSVDAGHDVFVAFPIANWAQITPATITSVEASLLHAGTGTTGSIAAGIAPNTAAPFVVAQSAQTMIGTQPNPGFTYDSSIAATFSGLENVNPVNEFWSLLTGTAGLTAPEITVEPAANVTMTSETTFYVNQTATGNTVTVDFADDLATTGVPTAFTTMYPDLLDTVGSVEVPVVYTVQLNAQNPTVPAATTPTYGGFPSGQTGGAANFSASGGNTWLYFTSPAGTGTLVQGLNMNSTGSGTGATSGTPTWTSTTANTTPVKTLNALLTQTNATAKLIGWFDETVDPYTQVSNSQVTFDHNAVLTAEYGTMKPVSVSPTPSTVAQGSSVNLTATYEIAIVSTNKVTSFNMGATGLGTGWQALFVNQGSGNAESNGVTVRAAESQAATVDGSKPFQATTSATVTANATADLGHYRVWPVLNNIAPVPTGTEGTVPAGSVYATVEVVAGTEPPAGEVNVIRMYNPNSGEHLYTTDPNEASTLENSFGWENENVAWVAPQSSAVPIWRLYNPYNGDHLYTTSANEYQTLSSPSGGWRGEGIKLYSAPNDGNSVPVYRLFNPHMTANGGAYAHLWTGDYNEYVTLWQRDGWSNESVAFYAVSVPNPS